jgi:hypothetical protein
MIPSLRLPTELCEMVIAYLDEPTLRACSLTCKAFLPASRFRLFYTVCLKGRKVKRFLEIINSSPELGLCVRTLRICEGRGRYRFEPRWLSSKLPLIASRLPEVTTLELDSMEWSLLDGDARTALISGFQKVKRLETIYSYFDDASQMNQFIASFPSLIDLFCYQTYLKTDSGRMETPMPSCVPLPLGLTTINLDSFQAGFFDQLMNLESHPNVRKLKFHSMDHPNAVGKLLKTIGSNLEHVDFHDFSSALGHMYNNADCEHSLIDITGSFTISNVSATAILENDIDFAHNNHLRSVELGCGPFSPQHPPPNWLFTIFSQLISPNLEHIRLQFGPRISSTGLDGIDWARMERVFTQPLFSNLKTLKLYVWAEPQVRSVAVELIRAQMPILEGRGILEL